MLGCMERSLYPGISKAELLAFTTDHLQRMIANNESGELTARITATTDYAALKDVQLVVEAVFEDRGIKAKVTKMLEEAGALERPTDTHAIERKKARVSEYMDYAERRGSLVHNA